MIKPKRLNKGDKVAIVSLSSGMIGDKQFIHKYYLGKTRLEEEFGLQVVAMPNALKGSTYLFEHPEARAKDMMDAFKDKSIKAIICAIGGEETYRLLPYIDFDIIKNNPKIFMGFSDSTTNHFMLYKAGVTSFYGPNIMCNFGEYGKMFDYEKNTILDILFDNKDNYQYSSSALAKYNLTDVLERFNSNKVELKDLKDCNNLKVFKTTLERMRDRKYFARSMLGQEVAVEPKKIIQEQLNYVLENLNPELSNFYQIVLYLIENGAYYELLVGGGDDVVCWEKVKDTSKTNWAYRLAKDKVI